MTGYEGGNIKKISKKEQGEVIVDKVLSTTSEIKVAEGESLVIGQVLVSTDGGLTFEKAVKNSKPNGILCENCCEEKTAEVLLIGKVKESELEGMDASHKQVLFENNIIVKG
jgi:hypothetical protein